MTREEKKSINQLRRLTLFAFACLAVFSFYCNLSFLQDVKPRIESLETKNELLLKSIAATNSYIDALEIKFYKNQKDLQAFKDMYERDLQKQEEFRKSISRESISLEIEEKDIMYMEQYDE